MNDNTYKRTSLTPADLFVLLDREYRRRRPSECTDCYVPLPYRTDGDRAGPNWEIAIPRDCTNGCAQLLESLVDEFRTLYSLKIPDGTERQ